MGNKINLICLICDNQFEAEMSWVNKGAKFCSRECYYKSKIGKRHDSVAIEKMRKAHQKGGNPNWNGGRYKTSCGYIRILKPEHPHADKDGYVFEHRYVLEKKIKRYMKTSERTHHSNGIKDDNRPENVELFERAGDHNRLHAIGRKFSEASREKMRRAKDHFVPWNKGKIMSKEMVKCLNGL